MCEPCKLSVQEVSANRHKGMGNRETSLLRSVALSKAPVLSCDHEGPTLGPCTPNPLLKSRLQHHSSEASMLTVWDPLTEGGVQWVP